MNENIGQHLKQTSSIGEYGEDSAVRYLVKHGYRIVSRNFSTQIGRNRKGVPINGEIDIVAMDGDILCFIEVKSTSDLSKSAEEAVTVKKTRILNRTARVFVKLFSLDKTTSRFDIIAINLRGQRAPKVRHLKGAWKPQ